jgi:hypothetical protein
VNRDGRETYPIANFPTQICIIWSWIKRIPTGREAYDYVSEPWLENLFSVEKNAGNNPLDVLMLFSPPYRLLVKIGTFVECAFLIRNEETFMIIFCMKFFNT